MRVVLTSVHCWPDVRRGGERYAHELSAALTRAGHQVRMLSTGSVPGRDSVLGVPVHRLPVRHDPRRRYPEPWSDLSVEAAFGAQSLAHLAPALFAGKVDVWHATSTGDGAAAAWCGDVASRLGRGVRTVFTDHGFPARRSRDARPDRRAHRRVVRRIGAYVCVSTAAARFLSADYGRVAAVIPPGVRLDAHQVASSRHPKPVLLYAGSLDTARKGVPLLLEAASLLAAEVPDLEVWLHGPGTVPASPVAGGRPLVTRAGLVTDEELRAAYATAWVTVLPSHAESFGMTVVESLASGTPAVVLADSGGPAEIVDDDRVGRSAPDTAAGLAAACAQALELAAKADTAAACRERAADFDWDAAIVPAMERVYDGAQP